MVAWTVTGHDVGIGEEVGQGEERRKQETQAEESRVTEGRHRGREKRRREREGDLHLSSSFPIYCGELSLRKVGQIDGTPLHSTDIRFPCRHHRRGGGTWLERQNSVSVVPPSSGEQQGVQCAGAYL